MPLSDHEFLNSTRNILVPELGEQHHAEGAGTSLCGLMLYALVRLCGAKKLLEIGVGRGCTTIPLLQAAHETGGFLNSIDPSPCEAARATVERCGLGHIWQFHEMTSDDYFATHDEVIELGFVDGDHWSPFVERDMTNVLRCLRPGGWAVFHDWNSAPREMMETYVNRKDSHGYGVARAAASTLHKFLPLDILPIHCGCFSDVSSEGGILVIQKPSPWSHNDVALLNDIRAGGYECKWEEPEPVQEVLETKS